jgi:hypothetical protein
MKEMLSRATVEKHLAKARMQDRKINYGCGAYKNNNIMRQRKKSNTIQQAS